MTFAFHCHSHRLGGITFILGFAFGFAFAFVAASHGFEEVMHCQRLHYFVLYFIVLYTILCFCKLNLVGIRLYDGDEREQELE